MCVNYCFLCYTRCSRIHLGCPPPPLTGFAALTRPPNLQPLLIGMSLMLFQQITGQPSVLYYAAAIFQSAGFASASEATRIAVVLGLFKLLMTGMQGQFEGLGGQCIRGGDGVLCRCCMGCGCGTVHVCVW